MNPYTKRVHALNHPPRYALKLALFCLCYLILMVVVWGLGKW